MGISGWGDGLAVPSAYLWVGFAVVIVLFGLVSGMLSFHWKNYGPSERVMKLVNRVYFTGAGIILLGMLISLLAYAQ